MKKLIIAAGLAVTLALAGCAGTDNENREAVGRLAVQYATIKVIERSDTITAEDVVAHVERVRALVDEDAEVSLADLRGELLSHIDMDGLDAADRLLVMTLLDQVELTLADEIEVGGLDEDAKARVAEVLGWVVRAAAMA